MGQQRALVAGLLGLFGGLGGLGVQVPSAPKDVERPTVDDVWNRVSRKPSKFRHDLSPSEMGRREKKKRKWRIARDSRKVNYARNGTRGGG